jgi:carbon starvation protein
MYVATLLAEGLALVLLFSTTGATPIWAVIWPVFGAANQLVAALALLALGAWLIKGLKVGSRWVMYPMWFMLFTTIAALILLIRDQLLGAVTNYVLVVIAVVLMVLALLMVREALVALKSDSPKKATTTPA